MGYTFDQTTPTTINQNQAFMAPVAQASWAFNTPVQLPYGGNEYLALPAASPAALPRLLSVLQHDKDSSERPSSDTSNAPRAVLAVHKVATTASRLFDFSGGSVQLMAVLLTTPNVVLHLPLLPSTRATLGDVTSAGMPGFFLHICACCCAHTTLFIQV